jgi:hypothetical protein
VGGIYFGAECHFFISDKGLPEPPTRIKAFCAFVLHGGQLFNYLNLLIMALYKITVKKQWYAAGQVLEPGMSVQVSSMILADPILINGGQLVRDAFLRVYGVDLQQMRALNGVILESERIG